MQWVRLCFVACCAVVLRFASGQFTDVSSASTVNFPCPPKCMCFRRQVRCLSLDLTQIPIVGSHTTLLDLRFNKIREIPPGRFKGHKHISSLLLNNNQITELKDGSFLGLPQLRHLYIYKNRIKYIEPGVFHDLPRLEILYLHYNDLEEIKGGTFTNMPSLHRLFLHYNKLKHIPKGTFTGMPKLTRLRLDSNNLVCDCSIAWLAAMLKTNSLQAAATCKYPVNMHGKSLKGMGLEEFNCKIPEIKEGPEDNEVTWGATAVFTCKINSNTSVSVVWMKDSKELPMDDERYAVMSDGSLRIVNSQDIDIGKYECMAKGPDGEVKSRAARMVVVKPEAKGRPKFVRAPSDVAVDAGAREARLLCRVTGNPRPIIMWSKNGIQLAPSSRFYVNNEGDLIIRPVDETDFGTYRCEASNDLGKVSGSAQLKINAQPVFTIHPESIKAQLGERAKFECVAVGYPPPSIIWFKDNTRLHNGGRFEIDPDGTRLTILDLLQQDAGLYVCEARNLLGYREVSANLEIEVVSKEPPWLVYKPYDIEAILGSTIEIPCRGEGNPTPGITWRKDGSSLPRTGRSRVSITGNLYISDVTLEDAGRYECSAINENGRATGEGLLTIKAEIHTTGLGDKFVKVAFAEASREVDKAINRTISSLFGRDDRTGPPNSADLFRLIRFPNAPARELARAAEVYERTLVNIRRHVESGMSTNYTTDFNYKELLSPDHLDLVAKLSGCMVHKKSHSCSDMCFHGKYRSIDGMCNNLENPFWGASLTGFRRVLQPIYENGFSQPVGWSKDRTYHGYPKPNSRLVSTSLISTKEVTPDEFITHMVMQWGQFLDHDLDHAIPSVSSESWDGIDCKKSCNYAAPCYPIDIPPGDPRVKNRRCIDFFRSSSICGSGMTSVFFDSIQPREQINQLTSYIDASQVYGFSQELATDLRDVTNDHGHLRVGIVFPGRKPLLPYAGTQGMDCRRDLSESNVNCFLAGDIRANEQIALLAMHTIWMREHNRVADNLRNLNPHWDGDIIYHEARKIVGATMQHITYNSWLPHIVGPEGMEMLGTYKGYDPSVNPSISNVFATAALRFGHSLINPMLHRLNASFQPIREGNIHLGKAFFAPWRLVDEGGVDPLLRGLFTVPAKLKRPDQNLNSELTEKLFSAAHAVALDLAAINIHRSRDHAIPGYTEFRRVCNMSVPETFDDLRHEISDYNVRRKLQELYGHPGNIDVWVGGILEDQSEGARVGPLFRCLLIEQFRRLRDGDRFWYENPSAFKAEQVAQIKQATLARVLCDNGDNLTEITRNVFVLPKLQNGYMSCDDVPRMSLKVWAECCNDCRSSGQLNTISRFNSQRNRRRTTDFSYPSDNPSFAAAADNTTLSDNSAKNGKRKKHGENATLKKDIANLQHTVTKLEKEIERINKMLVGL